MADGINLVEFKKPANEKLIRSAEEFLERVRSGSVTGAVFYYVTKDECFWLYSGFNALEAMAATKRLDHNLNKEWDKT